VQIPWPVPVMQAPIGPATTPELVTAVASTGALGTLAASWTRPEVLRRDVRRLRSTLEIPFCVNLVLAFDQRERLQVSLEEGVPLVSFSWGIDEELIRRAHEAGAGVLVQVGDVAGAVAAARAGADVVIAQGHEAGGHVRGSLPIVELVRSVRAVVALPIVAAGGIADPVAVSRAIAAGADAVACGTAFLAAAEADVHPRYLAGLIAADAGDTVLTSLFDVGWPDAAHRVLRNETVARWESAGRPPSGARPGEGEVVATRGSSSIVRYSDEQPTRETSGEIDAMAMYAGTSTSSVERSEPAAAITKRLAAGLP
jgi:nitronate monooxygenase